MAVAQDTTILGAPIFFYYLYILPLKKMLIADKIIGALQIQN